MYLRHANSATWANRLQKFKRLLPAEWNANTVRQLTRLEVVDRLVDDMTTPQRVAFMAALQQDNKLHISGYYHSMYSAWLPPPLQHKFQCDRITSLPLSELIANAKTEGNTVVGQLNNEKITKLSFTGTSDPTLALPGPADSKGTRIKTGPVVHQIDAWVSEEVRQQQDGSKEFKNYEIFLQLQKAVTTSMGYQPVFFHDASVGSFEPQALFVRAATSSIEDALFFRYMLVRCREYVPTRFSPDISVFNCGNFKWPADWVARGLNGPRNLPDKIGSSKFFLKNDMNGDVVVAGSPVEVFEDLRAHVHSTFFSVMQPEHFGGWSALQQELSEAVGETGMRQDFKDMMKPIVQEATRAVILPGDAVLQNGKVTVYVGTTLADEFGVRTSNDLFAAHDVIWGQEGFYYAWGGVVLPEGSTQPGVGDLVYKGSGSQGYVVKQLAPTIGQGATRTTASLAESRRDGWPDADSQSIRANAASAQNAEIVFLGNSEQTLTAEQAAQTYADLMNQKTPILYEELQSRFLSWAKDTPGVSFRVSVGRGGPSSYTTTSTQTTTTETTETATETEQQSTADAETQTETQQ
eukprot:TRINITY_DN86371_c0_g1_i1.p1 TRINITY_DN86371_c0_g1~~TRINITY_DN86371_c0_g1_i1.p1  ORF type:complete len:595 (+),score=107.75 TRINITY_DN86371_c0_g1_i1:50-1786(+)